MCCSLIGPTGGQAERTREEAQMTTVSTELHAADWEHQAQSLHVQAALEREQRQRLSDELRERRERHEALSDELAAAKAQLRQLKDVAEGTGSIREVEMADTASELQFAQSKLDDLAGQLEDSRMEREFLMQQLMQVDGGLGGADADPQQQDGEHVRQLTGERDAALEEAATLRTDNTALRRQLDAASAEHAAMASQLQQSMTDQAELLAQVRVTFSRAAFHHLFGRQPKTRGIQFVGLTMESSLPRDGAVFRR
jgi:regulator of replication initiation timing